MEKKASTTDYFDRMIDEEFSFIIKGADPFDFDGGFVAEVSREYNYVQLVLTSVRYQKDLFKTRFNCFPSFNVCNIFCFE